jgi:Secretion system C-terminal sorting domain
MKKVTHFMRLAKGALSLLAFVGFANSSMAQAPANDLCANAIPISCGQTVTGSTTTSTIDVAPACALNFPRFGVWYVFAGTGQSVTLSTCNATTNYDSQIGVYSGSCGSLVCVAGNDNAPTCSAGGRKSTVTFTSVAGTNYYIWVTGAVSARGNFALSVACAGSVGINCATAPVMACGTPVTATMSGSGAGWNVSACGFSTPGQEQVFRFTAPMNGVYTLQVLAASGGYVDYFYKSATGTCDATGWICIDDIFSPGTYSLNLTAGNYYLLMDAEGTSSRTHTCQILCPTAPPPPSDNDLCSASVPLLACGGSVSGTTVGATSDAVPTCGTSLNTAPSRWYRFIGTGQTVTITTCNAGSNYDTKLGIFTGSCGALTCVTGNDDSSCSFSSLRSTVTFTSVSGTTYFVYVTGFGSGAGNFQVTATCSLKEDDTSLNGLSAGNAVDLGSDMVGEFFPNPAQSGQSVLRVVSTQDSEATITLFDALGRAILNQRTGVVAGSNQLELNVASVPSGTYFAVVRMNGQQYHKKLVVGR